MSVFIFKREIDGAEHWSREMPIQSSLEWLKKAGYKLQKKGSPTGIAKHRIEITGPFFKPKDHYLTNEGYPLGTTCWYFIVWSNGLRKLCCGITEENAWEESLKFLQEEREEVPSE
jgi:hypothetical protein